ncbi:hypothetical protein PAA8504_00327 [Palleronia abyssalis]|uniref:Uncharacterized protein n=2 Tax=Palleronia TaxID=315422 RepID=A0A2R8BQR4_9RHOB|nr:hypothetical protein SAMN04488011_11225 [Palleronia pelagia]SPJ22533.1 hypothetical protein PAA8504_00327 [Palleronia abyssalis]
MEYRSLNRDGDTRRFFDDAAMYACPCDADERTTEMLHSGAS